MLRRKEKKKKAIIKRDAPGAGFGANTPVSLSNIHDLGAFKRFKCFFGPRTMMMRCLLLLHHNINDEIQLKGRRFGGVLLGSFFFFFFLILQSRRAKKRGLEKSQQQQKKRSRLLVWKKKF